jgi:hypothetical protein
LSEWAATISRISRGALQGEVAGLAIALGGQGALGGVDHEEPAIQAAGVHARQVDLGAVGLDLVPVDHAPALAGEVLGRVEVGVEGQDLLVQGPVGLGDGRRRRIGASSGVAAVASRAAEPRRTVSRRDIWAPT